MQSFISSVSSLLGAQAGPSPLQQAGLLQLRPEHPRLFVTSLEQLHTAFDRNRVGGSLLRTRLLTNLVALADIALSSSPIQRDQSLFGDDGKRVQFHHEARKAVSVIFDCCAAFFYTQQIKYRDYAVATMLHVSSFPDWNAGEKFLDNAEISFAVSVGYDWLYHTLSTDERREIEAGLYKHSLALAPIVYGLVDSVGLSIDNAWTRKDSNGNLVNNCGLLSAALALGSIHPGLLDIVLTEMRKSIASSMQAYEPDGAWHEGPQYWSYGTQNAVYIVALLESSLTSTLPLGSSSSSSSPDHLGILAQFPGFARTALYRYYIVSPAGISFNYGDNNQDYMSAEPHYTWLSQRFSECAHCEAHSHQLLMEKLDKAEKKGPKKQNKFDRNMAMHALWFPLSEGNVSADSAPVCLPRQLDVRFRGPGEIAVLCSDWENKENNAIYIGLKGGSNGNSHGHLDLGSFVLDALGVRWSLDFGGDDYALPDYASKKKDSKRWDYLRTSNRGHSTITIGSAVSNGPSIPHVSVSKQLLTAETVLTHFHSSPGRGHAVLDMSSVYATSQAYRHHRGVALINNRTQVLVQDDFSACSGSSTLDGLGIIWRMMTASTVRIVSHQLAILTQKDVVLRAELVEVTSPGQVGRAAFSLLSARPDEPAPLVGVAVEECADGEGDEAEEEEEEDDGEEEGDGGGDGDGDGDDAFVDESELTEKEIKKLRQKEEKRAARKALRQQEREERQRLKRAHKGKDKDAKADKRSREGKANQKDESVFRRGVDRSKVKEDPNDGVSCLVITALLSGAAHQIAVVFTPVGNESASTEKAVRLPPVTSWEGAI